MAISFTQAAFVGSTQGSINASLTNITNSSKKILFVILKSNGPYPVTRAYYAGTTMTLLASVDVYNSGSFWVYYLFQPEEGSTNFGTTTDYYNAVYSFSYAIYDGVDVGMSLSPITNITSGTAARLDIEGTTTKANSWLTSFFASYEYALSTVGGTPLTSRITPNTSTQVVDSGLINPQASMYMTALSTMYTSHIGGVVVELQPYLQKAPLPTFLTP